MKIWKLSVLLIISVISTSCVYAPKFANRQIPKEKCDLVTKKLTLKLTEANVNCGVTPDRIFNCLVGAGLIVPISGVVSGSIVVIGNTIHWAEKELSCPKNSNKSKKTKDT